MTVRRLLIAMAVAAGASAVLGGVAQAAGTGGIELTPGGTGSAFHVSLEAGQRGTAEFTLTNLQGAPAQIRLYAAAATKGADGGYAVGGPGSAAWISIDDQVVRLSPHQARTYRFAIDRDSAPRGEGLTYGAVVLEQAGGNVVTRAATLVYLDRVGPGGSAPAAAPLGPPRDVEVLTHDAAPVVRIGGDGPSHTWLYGVAGGLVAVVGGLVPLAARRRTPVVVPAPRADAQPLLRP